MYKKDGGDRGGNGGRRGRGGRRGGGGYRGVRGGYRGGRGQRGGPPSGLSGRDIGMWHRQRSIQRKIENERNQRQDIHMTEQHEGYLTAILDELSEASSGTKPVIKSEELESSSDAPGMVASFKQNTNSSYDEDPVLNEQLKHDLVKKDKVQKMAGFRKKLPAYGMRETIADMIANNQVVVISGETGCGKTTQVGQFILDDSIEKGKGSLCRIVCTQPRRISAISIAERVADERNERLGASCGYQIALECVAPRAKGSILYCTTGVLLRRLIGDSDFSRASHIIIDEIHERNIQSDFLLIVVKIILSRRPDLKVVLMSATLNAKLFSQYFNNCPMLNIPGFTFPVQQYFLEEIIQMIGYKAAPKVYRRRYYGRGRDPNWRKQEELWEQYLNSLRQSGCNEATLECLQDINFEKTDYVYALVEQLLMHICRNMQDGAVLVFLPGWSDISNVHGVLKKNTFFQPDSFIILPLHSLMPTVSQRQIFDRPPKGKRKIILATCIAETSITIEDIVYVVDCGKTKEKNFNVEQQVETLLPVWCSKASCTQRKGRAGRVQAGHCFYLFTKFHHEQMADYQLAEILRTPLEEIALQVKSLNLGMTEAFLSQALEPPSRDTILHALTTLTQINAIDGNENLTPLGYHLARLPVHPRIGKIILFGAIMSCLDPILTIASSMSFKEPYVIPLNKERQADECRERLSNGNQSDHLTLYNAFKQWELAERCGNSSRFCWDNFLSHSSLQMIRDRKVDFAEHLCHIGFIPNSDPNQVEANYNSQNDALIKAVLCAGFYPNVIYVHRPAICGRPALLYIQQDGRQRKVSVHPKSVNSDETNFNSNWLIYREKVQSTSLYIHDCSTVTPYALLFFGGDITVTKDNGQDIVTVDQWIKFNCRESVANIVKRLRDELNKFLAQKVRNPALSLNLDKVYSKDRESMLVKTIIELITSQ